MSYALAVTNPSVKQRVVNPVVTPQTQSPPKTHNPPPKKETPQQTITPPSPTGVSPSIVFELKIPVSQKKEQEGLEDSTDLAESFEENEEEGSNDSDNTKQNKQKFHTYVVDGLEQRQARINDLVTYLLNNCDDKNFEMRGGFRISKRINTKDGNAKKSSLPQFDLETIPQALGWVKSIVDLLRNSPSVNVPINNQDELVFVRGGNQVRVTRNNGSKNKEMWFQLEDLALEIREQGKKYLKVAQAVEDTLERKESRADKSKKEQMKKRRIAVSDKLQTRTFRSLLKTMKDLFLSSDLPALKEKYQKQEQIKDQVRKRLIEQNRDMMMMALNAAPEGFMEMDISHIGRTEEPQEIVEEVPVVQQNTSADNAQDTPPVVKEKRKKRTKAEIRRAQEENFDNIELAQETVVEPQQQVSKTNQNESTQSKGYAYQNSFDLGEISQENIFEITQSETRTTIVNEHKKSKSNKPQKKTGNNQTSTATTSSKPSQPKKKNKSKNEKTKKSPAAQVQIEEEKQSVNTPVLLVAGAATVVALYYAYTLLQ